MYCLFPVQQHQMCIRDRVSRPTIYNLLKKKEFRWIQLDGGKYRISKKSFDDWLDNLEQ